MRYDFVILEPNQLLYFSSKGWFGERALADHFSLSDGKRVLQELQQDKAIPMHKKKNLALHSASFLDLFFADPDYAYLNFQKLFS